MLTVQQVYDFINERAPFETQLAFDNSGLLVGHPDNEVTGVHFALDVTNHVIDEAIANGANLIVTHHPLIFRPLPNITDETSIGRGIMTLCSHGICAVNAHTNLDCAEGGVNDVLSDALGLVNVSTVPGDSHGLLRMGEVPEQDLAGFLASVKEKLGCDGLRYVESGKPVRKVAVGGGSCADGMLDALDAGCDTFVTSDIKYNQFWDAKDLGLNLIDAGHFCTENPVVAVLARKIAAAFPEIEVKISESHRDCMKFY